VGAHSQESPDRKLRQVQGQKPSAPRRLESGETTPRTEGGKPPKASEAKPRKELELAGRALLTAGKQILQPQNGGLTIEATVADFLEFTKIKRRPHTCLRYRPVQEHFRAFARPCTQADAIPPADIDGYRAERLAEKNPKGKALCFP